MNKTELEEMYLKSEIVDFEEVPEAAVLIGELEVLAFMAQIFETPDGKYLSCVKKGK